MFHRIIYPGSPQPQAFRGEKTRVRALQQLSKETQSTYTIKKIIIKDNTTAKPIGQAQPHSILSFLFISLIYPIPGN